MRRAARHWGGFVAQGELDSTVIASAGRADTLPERQAITGFDYAYVKRAADILVCLLALPIFVLTATALACLNPLFNAGPLFFTQYRMGRDGRAFRIWKFRSMLPIKGNHRGPEDPLETDRITSLGAFLRRTRIDELPQLINVLRGDMSIIGPRPDVYDYAKCYVDTVPGYASRHAVRPGITGLAQVEAGYVEGTTGTLAKARYDNLYIRRMGWQLDLRIAVRTIAVMMTGFGAR